MKILDEATVKMNVKTEVIQMDAPIILKKTVVENGTYNASEDNATAYNPIIVDVPTFEQENEELTKEVVELNNVIDEKDKEIIELQEDVAEAYDAGKQAQYDEFWDLYQENGERRNYVNSFSGIGWNDNIFKPKYDIVPTTAFGASMFQSSGIVNLKQCLIDAGVTLDLSELTSATYIFRDSFITDYPYIDLSSANSVVYAFYSCKGVNLTLKLGANTTYSNTFQNSSSFVKLIIEGTIGQNGFNVQWATKLDYESLLSIKNALADKSKDTSGTTWVVTVGSANKAKYTEKDIEEIKAKGWDIQ